MSEILTNTGITLWSKDDYGELWLSVFEQLTGSAGKSNLRLIDETIGKINESLNGYSLVYKDNRLYISKDGTDIPVSLIDSITGNTASSVDGKTITIDENGVIHGMTVDNAFDLTSTNAISNSAVSNKFAEVDEKLNTASTTLTNLSDKVEALVGEGEGSVKNIAENVVAEEVSKEVAKIVDNAPEDLDTLKEMSDWINNHASSAAEMNSSIQANTVSIEELKTNKANSDDLTVHTENTDVHVTTDEKVIVSKLGESEDGNLTYNGESIKGGGSSIVVSTTHPSNPNVGDLWFAVDETLDFVLSNDTKSMYFGDVEPSGDVVLKKRFSNDGVKYQLTKISAQLANNSIDNITSIFIPNNVFIGNTIFNESTKLKKITFGKNVTLKNVPFYNTKNVESIYMLGNLSANSSSCMMGVGADVYTTLYMSDDVTDVPRFFSCSDDPSLYSDSVPSINKVILGKNVTKIEEGSFSGNSQVEEIDFGNSKITHICDYAFRSNVKINLSNIIPDSVTTIGKYAFWKCTNLTEMVIPDSVVEIGDNAFSDCINLSNVTLPQNLSDTTLYYTFAYCTSLKEIVIPDGIKEINEVCLGCTALEKVTIPVSAYFNSGFDGCNNINSVTFTLGTGIIPDSNGGRAPWDASTLIAELKIPNGTTIIGRNSFEYMTTIPIMYLPKTLTLIKYGAFQNSNITIHFEGTEDEWNNIEKEDYWDYDATITMVYNSY